MVDISFSGFDTDKAVAYKREMMERYLRLVVKPEPSTTTIPKWSEPTTPELKEPVITKTTSNKPELDRVFNGFDPAKEGEQNKPTQEQQQTFYLREILAIVTEMLYPGKFTPQQIRHCLLYTSPSPRDRTRSRMPSSA